MYHSFIFTLLENIGAGLTAKKENYTLMKKKKNMKKKES